MNPVSLLPHLVLHNNTFNNRDNLQMLIMVTVCRV